MREWLDDYWPPLAILTAAVALILLFFVAASGGSHDKIAGPDFMLVCVSHEFTKSQCEFLADMVKHGDNQANFNSAMSGVAIGLSAGAKR